MDNLLALLEKKAKEKEELESRLVAIEEELTTLLKALDLLNKEEMKESNKQLELLQIEQSQEYRDMKFDEAVLDILEKNPHKKFRPKDIKAALLKGGYQSKAKNFAATVRTRLQQIREKDLVECEKTTKGKKEIWQYWNKKKDNRPDGLKIIDEIRRTKPPIHGPFSGLERESK